MRIIKILSRFLICILCIGMLCTTSFADEPNPGEVGNYGEVLTPENLETITNNMRDGAENFQRQFNSNLQSSNFVPWEVRIGLMLMKALSAIDYVLQVSLVRFTIIFLLIMYALWMAVEAYKMIRDTPDYKEVVFNIFKKGMIITVWIILLNYGAAKIFTTLVSPILNLCTYISDFILNAVAESRNVQLTDTCSAIHRFVNENAVTQVKHGAANLLIDNETAANIMCLPGRLSMYFYHAIGTALKWFLWGFGHSVTAIFMGGICIFVFVKCVFKYAFMTLGVVANLFLTLLMLPFTALAEALPDKSEKTYIGQVLNGFLSMFKTKKTSEVLSVFINAGVYFISLAIIITICAALLDNIIPTDGSFTDYGAGKAVTNIVCGCLVLYLAGKADEMAKKVGGSIDNSFGENVQKDSQALWGKAKSVGGKIFKDWIKTK